MGRNKTDIEAFISAFNADPGGREGLVAGLVAAEGRLPLNLPGRGAARLISERLREGPFSPFYDFEMILARTLHRHLADLKLNILADIRINDLFDERYRAYAVEAGPAVRQGSGIGPLREVIARMVRREGHRMALKFCDLVVKWANPGLYRAMRPLEVCVMDMKEGLSAGVPPRLGQVTALFEEFTGREGRAAARLLLERMDWDDELSEFVPGLQEALHAGGDGEETAGPAGAGAEDLSDWQDEESPGREVIDEDAGSPPAEAPRPEKREGSATAPMTRTGKYAQILKREYLDMKDPGDEEGIRLLIDRIQEKNGKAFGDDRASEIVDEVLELWSADASIDGEVRYLIETIREERQGAVPQPLPEESDTQPDDELPRPEAGSAGDAPVSTGEMEALLTEIDAGSGPGGLNDSAREDAEYAETEEPEPGRPAVRGGTGAAARVDTADDGIFLDELEAEVSGETNVDDATGVVTEEDTFLLDELLKSESADRKAEAGAGPEDEYLIEQSTDESDTPEPEVSLKEDPPRPVKETTDDKEEFTVQDEILFQDDPEKRKKTRFERPRKGTRITKIEISDPDE